MSQGIESTGAFRKVMASARRHSGMTSAAFDFSLSTGEVTDGDPIRYAR